MPRKVVLHVGAPKTGTTFLQQVLWSQHDLAREQGLLLPGASFHDHYLASIDVRELSYEPRYPPRSIGMWTTLVEEGQSFDGNVLVSHELFAGATAAQAMTAVKAWGGAEVHVVVSARDLVRQIPAEWQEHIKHRSTVTFSDFVAELKVRGPKAAWFWTVQDYADVCQRWGAAVPPDRLHVVTVPPRGARPEALWERFAGLVGLDAAAFDVSISRSNSSLRAEQAELLRRLNDQLGPQRLSLPGIYSETVKEILAQDVLAGRPGARVVLLGEDRSFAVERSRQIVSELRTMGVDVVGDLAELVPPMQSADDSDGFTEHPESTPDPLLLRESIEALTGLLLRLSAERRAARAQTKTTVAAQTAHRAAQSQLEALSAVHESLRAEHADLVDGLRAQPLKTLFIAAAERTPWLMRWRVRYWRVVNLGRRLAAPVRRLRQP